MLDERIFPLSTTDIRLKKDLGTDGSVDKLTVHEKVDSVKTEIDAILVDTADIQPRLISVENTVNSIEVDVADVMVVVGANSSELTSAVYGLAALGHNIDLIDANVDSVKASLGEPTIGTVSSNVEDIKTNLGKTVIGTVASHVENIGSLIGSPVSGSVSSDLLELDSKISQIQNNTRTIIAVNSEFEPPAENDTMYFKIKLANYDTAGDMSIPDSAPAVSVETSEGFDRSVNLGDWNGSVFSAGATMIDVSDGVYYIYYKLPWNAAPNEQLIFRFTIIENLRTRFIFRTVYVVEESSTSFNASDRSTINTTGTNVNGVIATLGAPVNSVSQDIANVTSDVATVNGKVDIVDSNVDTIKDVLLPEIRTKAIGTFNREIMSLEALAGALATLITADVIWEANKTSGSIIGAGSEMVLLGESEGMVKPKGTLNSFIVAPVTSCRNYTVEIFEDSLFNRLIAKVSSWDSVSDGLLHVVVDKIYINPGFLNQLYVKITNHTATASSFNVSLRGH